MQRNILQEWLMRLFGRKTDYYAMYRNYVHISQCLYTRYEIENIVRNKRYGSFINF